MAANLSVRDIIGVARARVHRVWTYFDAVIFKLRVCLTHRTATMSVDQHWRMHANPDFVAKVGPMFLGTFVAHEILHIILRHHERLTKNAMFALRYARVARIIRQMFTGRVAVTDYQVFCNVVADFEVNAVVDAAGFKWPADFKPLRAELFGLPMKQTVEVWMDALLKRAEEQQQQEQDNDKGSDDGRSGDGEAGEAGAGGQAGEGDDSQAPQTGRDEEDEGDGEAGGEDEEGGEDDGEGEGAGEVGEAGEDDDDDAGREGDGDADADEGGEDGDAEAHERDGAGEGDAGEGARGTDADDAHPRHAEVGGGCCGGCAGTPLDYEFDDDGEPLPTPVSEQEQAVARQMVAQAIVEAAAQKSIGSGAGDILMEWAREMLAPPKVRWQSVLASKWRGIVSNVRGMVDRKYGPVSRERIALVAGGFGNKAPILPGWRGTQPVVLVGVDSSGSMGQGKDSPLNDALSETAGLLMVSNVEAWGAAVDAQVHTVKRLRTNGDVLSLAQGGGGTDMRAFFKLVEQTKPRPHIAVLITDGQTPWPEPKEVAVDVQFVILLVGRYKEQPPAHLRSCVIEVK